MKSRHKEIRRVDTRGHAIWVTDGEWQIIKTNYKVINKFLKLNHRNILTLYDAVSAIFWCGVVTTSVFVTTYVDDCI